MSKWRIALAIAAMIIVALWFFGPPEQICEPAKQVGHEDCATYGLLLFLAIKIGEFLDLHNGLIIAIFTGTLWWSTHSLWKAGEKQLAHAENTAKRELRTYLDFHNVGWDREKTPEGEKKVVPRIIVRVRNYGKTPASEIDLEMRLSVRKVATGDEINILEGEKIVEHWGGVAPGDHFTKRLGLPNMPDNVWQLLTKEDVARMVCKVTIKYLDVFKAPHTLESDFESVGHRKLFSVVLGTRKAD